MIETQKCSVGIFQKYDIDLIDFDGFCLPKSENERKIFKGPADCLAK